MLVSYEVVSDVNHEKAVKLLREVAQGKFGKVFTSDYIFDEIVTVTFVKTKDLGKAILAGLYIRESTEVLKINQAVFEDAWNLFKKQKETRLSFTDCTTISIMKDNDIKNIATFDKDFRKVKEINAMGLE